MTYAIVFSDLALKQLKKLDRTIQKRILSAVEKLSENPERFVTKLVGDPGYRLRVGDFRVIVDIHENELRVLVLKIGHRKNIYN
jgi:mRNA interferase RelE/StbE